MKLILKLLLFFLLLTQFNYAQSKLKQVKENLSENETTSNNNITNNDNVSSTKGSSSFGNKLFVDLLVKPLIWVGKQAILGEAEDRAIVFYPYHNRYQGEYYYSNSNNDKTSLLELNSFYISSKDAVKGLNIDLNYRFTPLIGIKLKHLHFSEKYFGKTEYLDISSLLFNYYRIREKYITAHWGLGISYIANSVKKIAFSYAVGMELFPVNPISLSFSWQQNFVNTLSIDELKLQLNYHIKQFSPFIGYYNYNLAGIKNPSLGFGCNYRF